MYLSPKHPGMKTAFKCHLMTGAVLSVAADAAVAVTAAVVADTLVLLGLLMPR